MSEDEDDDQYDPEQDQTSDEEDPDVTDDQREVFKSRKGDISWLSSPLQTQSRAPTENILRMTPGPTRYAVSHAQDIKSAFELFFTRPIQNILLEMTNMEERRVFGDSWTEKHSSMPTWDCCFLRGYTDPVMKLRPAYGIEVIGMVK